MTGRKPLSEEDAEKTVLAARPVFDDEPEPSSETERKPKARPDLADDSAPAAVGPTVTPASLDASGPRVTRSKGPASTSPSHELRGLRTLPPQIGRRIEGSAEARRPDVAPRRTHEDARPRLRLPSVDPPLKSTEDLRLPESPPARPAPPPVPLPRLEPVSPTGGFRTAGPLTGIALVLVAVVFIVFVRGTRPQTVAYREADPAPVPARERRSAGSAPTSWQERYRQQRPELLVGSPKLNYIERPVPPRVRRLPRSGRVRGDGNLWPPQRVRASEGPAPLVLPPNIETPRYEGVEPAEETPAAIPLISVRSVPPGARVEIEGKVLGLTPFIRGRPEGMSRVRVTLRLAGYLSYTGILREDDGGHLHLEAKLDPDPQVDPRLRGEHASSVDPED